MPSSNHDTNSFEVPFYASFLYFPSQKAMKTFPTLADLLSIIAEYQNNVWLPKYPGHAEHYWATLNKLEEEVREVRDAFRDSDCAVMTPQELADVGIVWLSACSIWGIDIVGEILKKMAVNYERQNMPAPENLAALIRAHFSKGT